PERPAGARRGAAGRIASSPTLGVGAAATPQHLGVALLTDRAQWLTFPIPENCTRIWALVGGHRARPAPHGGRRVKDGQAEWPRAAMRSRPGGDGRWKER